MQLFKFDWFSSKEREELIRLREENNRLKESQKEINTILGDSYETIVANKQGKPYKSLRLVGDTTIVVLHDGATLSKEGRENFELVKAATSEQQVLDIFIAPVASKINNNTREMEIVIPNRDVLQDNEDFVIKGDDTYLKGINVPLPAIVVASFIEILEKIDAIDFGAGNVEVQGIRQLEQQYEALKMFTYKLFLCPIEEGRTSLLRFVKENNVKITSNGNFVGFRRIVNKGTDTELINFISAEYFRAMKEKKDTTDLYVVRVTETYEEQEIFDDGNYGEAEWDEDEEDWIDGDWISNMQTRTVTKERKSLKLSAGFEPLNENDEVVGNLQDLYLDLPNLQENRYTDNHTKKYDIRIGATYKINPDEIDLKSYYKSCGGALHISDGRNYDYKGFGDTPVVAIINPMHVVKMDTGTTGKIGVSQMFIASITSQNEDGTYVDIDDQDLVNFDAIYHNESIEELETAIREKTFAPFSVEENTAPVSVTDIKFISEQLKSRVSQVI